MMNKNHKIVVLVVISLLTAGALFAVIWNSTNDLELNLVNAATSSSGVTVRYEINNHSSGSWTCDPSKFRVEFSDGTSYPVIAESSNLFIIAGGGSASGLLFSSQNPSGATVVGLTYSDGSTQLRTT